jgi:hypothetical protein
MMSPLPVPTVCVPLPKEVTGPDAAAVDVLDAAAVDVLVALDELVVAVVEVLFALFPELLSTPPIAPPMPKSTTTAMVQNHHLL